MRREGRAAFTGNREDMLKVESLPRAPTREENEACPGT
jgi:hypothetical protein